MCHPEGYVFAPFLSENEHRLCLFWSGIGYGFLEGTTGVYERINRASINTFMRIRNGFEEVFCLRSNLSNDDIISA